MSATVDVLAVLDDAFAELCRYGEPGNYVAADRLDQARAAVADLVDAAANVVADVRSNKEPDLIALADCIKAAGGRDVLKTALRNAGARKYTLADYLGGQP